ncbi:hypothetical protein SAMN05892883_2071 [Jatrophihabitans sp. GAS493]|uniref:phage tail terminator protein n=1 Tax=Jatrophihabitans sp. GAS493 TaxID=1907575 RepID=UPI000BB6C232|nr:minor capsid protein [Jatrophihabitans sp. GAS493]SOD72721.1 hypothetical protein SAMN05892883_2071 [Jatrophihabitans sp. GAS493]
MSHTLDLVSGMAQAIHDAGIGTYRADQADYLDGEIGCHFHRMPPLGAAIVFTPYTPGGDSLAQATGIIAVQIKVRGNTDPFYLVALVDEIYQLFQGLTNVVYGSIIVTQMTNRSSVPLGQDSDGRWSHSLNFYCDVVTPPSLNRPY